MRRKPPNIDFSLETASELEAIRARIGQPVPLSLRYALGPKATLVSLDGDLATLLFPNGARLDRVLFR